MGSDAQQWILLIGVLHTPGYDTGPPLAIEWLFLPLSPVTRPLIQQSMLLILMAPLLLPRGVKRGEITVSWCQIILLG